MITREEIDKIRTRILDALNGMKNRTAVQGGMPGLTDPAFEIAKGTVVSQLGLFFAEADLKAQICQLDGTSPEMKAARGLIDRIEQSVLAAVDEARDQTTPPRDELSFEHVKTKVSLAVHKIRMETTIANLETGLAAMAAEKSSK